MNDCRYIQPYSKRKDMIVHYIAIFAFVLYNVPIKPLKEWYQAGIS